MAEYSNNNGQGSNIFRVVAGIAIILIGIGVLNQFFGLKYPEFKFNLLKNFQNKTETKSTEINIEEPDITLKSLKFFEAGYHAPKESEITYKIIFQKNTTRYIWWKLLYKNNNYKIEDTDIPLKLKWYDPEGNTITVDDIKLNVKQDWDTAWYISGWGWDKPGHWKPGKYTVMLYYKGNLFASNSYTIENM